MARNKFGVKLLLYASAQFVALTFGAMFFYPGGAMYEPDAKRYLFFRNFFSDLGATHTRGGESNMNAMVLFVIALGTIGVSLVVAAPAWKSTIATAGRGQAFGTGAQLFSVLSGICYVGIAVTPWNLVLNLHMLFVQGAFTLLLGFVICLTVMEMQNRWPVRYIASNAIYIAVLTTYVFVLFHGPNLLTLHGLVFQVVAQKLIVYISILNLAYQCWSLLSHIEAGS